MVVNEWLVSIVVIVGLLATWRLLRWRFRPSLVLGPRLRAEADRITLRVRNHGAATARRCAGRPLRLDRKVRDDWTRIEVDPRACPFEWTEGGRERDLEPGADAGLVVALSDRLPEGRYRLELAVMNGEERRTRLEFDVPPNGMMRRGEAIPARNGVEEER